MDASLKTWHDNLKHGNDTPKYIIDMFQMSFEAIIIDWLRLASSISAIFRTRTSSMIYIKNYKAMYILYLFIVMLYFLYFCIWWWEIQILCGMWSTGFSLPLEKYRDWVVTNILIFCSIYNEPILFRNHQRRF